MHFVGKIEQAARDPLPGYEGHCAGYSRSVLVGAAVGSVHMGLGLNRLEPDGRLDPHVHSYEEGFYVLEGSVVLALGGRSYTLAQGDYGIVPVGALHAFHNAEAGDARWLEMSSSQPRVEPRDGAFPRDTFFLPEKDAPAVAHRPDFTDPRTHFLGHFDRSQLPPPAEFSIDGYSGGNIYGVSIKTMVGRVLGANLLTMFMVQFQPGGAGTVHDHPFEESYFFLAGEAEAVLDGMSYRVRAGDVVWTGVGGTHGFFNTGKEPVWWLETQSPQPPAQQAFRFARDWEHVNRVLGAAPTETTA